MTELDWWDYDGWPSRAGEWEGGPARGGSEFDNIDFHVDLGCGRLPKARIGIDRYPAPGVAVVADLEELRTFGVPLAPGVEGWRTNGERLILDNPGQISYGYLPGDEWMDLQAGRRMLPFPDSSIKSIISHHFFEHVGPGFIPLVDEIYRVLEPGGILRAITPLFPSWSAVSDPDHKRYFMADPESGACTWDVFCGTPGDTPSNCWLSSFSVPYTKARFEKVDQDMTAPPPLEARWTAADARELRVALRAMK